MCFQGEDLTELKLRVNILLLFAHGGVLRVEFHSVMSAVDVPGLCYGFACYC